MIHRQSIQTGKPFTAGPNITFNWQESRKMFSYWFYPAEARTCLYVALATGEAVPKGTKVKRLVSTVILPDGHHAFHLVELENIWTFAAAT